MTLNRAQPGDAVLQRFQPDFVHQLLKIVLNGLAQIMPD
jgi:hypothetical protein